jgi:hypothetical protein
MTGGFGIDKTGLPCAIGASLAFFSLPSRFLQPGQMKSRKVRNGADMFLYEYTGTIALIFARQQNIPFSQGRSINSDAGSGDRT